MRPGRLGRALVLAAPAAWLGAFFLLPLAMIGRISLSESAVAQPPYRPLVPATLDPASWGTFLSGLGLDSFRALAAEPLYRDAALSSLAYGAASTAILLALGYPFALAMARAPRGWQPALVALVTLPFWTSLLVRVYAWSAILKDDGLLNRALAALHLVSAPLRILDTPAAILIGLVYAYLPFMVLPLYGALAGADPALPEAASDLGASPARIFRTVTLPLSLRGAGAGALLCFIPIVGEFVIPDLLGGSDTLMLGRVLWSEFSANRDWPLASAAAIVMLALLAGPILLFRRVETRRMEART